MGGSSKKVTVGYKYYLGMHMVLCHGPIDRISHILVDKKVAWLGEVDHGSIRVNAANLFGGESREGGVSGTLDVLSGKGDQTVNNYLQNKIGGLVPSFRGVTSVVLRQMYLGINPYLKAWSFKATRVMIRQKGIAQWYPEKAPISVDAAAIVGGPWQYKILPYHENPGYSNLIPPTEWDGTATLPIRDGVWLYPTPEGWPTPQLSICWVKKVIPNVSEGAVLQLRADNGCLLWVNGQYIGASNRDNDNIPSNQNYPVNFTVPTRGTYTIIGKAYTESSAVGQAGNYLSVTVAGVPPGEDMNPAHIIRECLTDPDWGMGYNEGDIDDTSFKGAADTLWNEGMGMSLLWDRQKGIEEFIAEVIKHIDAALYVDRYTGKFVLKLIRKDYNEANLLLLDENNIDKISSFSKPTFGELTNSVTVNYWDAATNTDASVTASDIALAQMQQADIGTTLQYPGFTNRHIATLVAQRDLTSLSTPLITCTIYASSEANVLNVGDVFRLSWEDYAVDRVVMRVTGIAYGDGKTNRVRITASEDIFALPQTAIVTGGDIDWEDPVTGPQAATIRIVGEAPYIALFNEVGKDIVDNQLSNDSASSFTFASAVSPVAGAINAIVMEDSGAGYAEQGTADFCPSGVLSTAVDKQSTILVLDNAEEFEQLGTGGFIQVNDELMRLDGVNLGANSLTVARGVFDTVPEHHAANSVVFAWDGYAYVGATEYSSGEQINLMLLPVTGKGALSEVGAPVDTITMTGRAARPYPPANVKLNGQYWPTDVSGTLNVTWVHRNREAQQDVAIPFIAATVEPIANTRYTIRFKDGDGVLLIEQDNIGPGLAVVKLDHTGLTQMELFTVNNVGASMQSVTHEFNYTPPAGITESEIIAEVYTPSDDSTIIDGGDLDG